MEMFSGFIHGLGIALQPLNLGLMIVGVVVGVVAGALPGISFVNAMAIALPFTYFMSPLVALGYALFGVTCLALGTGTRAIRSSA